MNYMDAAKSLCPRATEITKYGPYGFFAGQVSEIWYKREGEYNTCFLVEACGDPVVLDGFANFVLWIQDQQRKYEESHLAEERKRQRAEQGQQQAELETLRAELGRLQAAPPQPPQKREQGLTASLIGIGVLILVGAIAFGGQFFGITYPIQMAAALVLAILGAGAALRIFGFHFRFREFDLSKLLTLGR